MKLHILLPYIGKLKTTLFDAREGYSIMFETSIVYKRSEGFLQGNNWIHLRILGFGIGVSWE